MARCDQRRLVWAWLSLGCVERCVWEGYTSPSLRGVYVRSVASGVRWAWPAEMVFDTEAQAVEASLRGEDDDDAPGMRADVYDNGCDWAEPL